MIMKKICMVAVLCFSFILNVNAAIDKDKAQSMIEDLTLRGIDGIINSNATEQEKIDVFRTLFVQNLDLNFIGKYVLGRYWRVATPAQQKEFIELYKEFNVKTWSKRFDEFKGKKFVFEGVSGSSNPDQVFVNTSVPMEDGAPISVKWRVYERKGELKVIDIIIENISLAQTSRNEYSSFIAKSPKGIDGLLENLRLKLK